MERITVGMLNRKVEWLKALGIQVSLDHHQPGGNTQTWAVESLDGARRIGWSGRMTKRECLIFLCGLIEGAEQKDAQCHAKAVGYSNYIDTLLKVKPLTGGPIRG